MGRWVNILICALIEKLLINNMNTFIILYLNQMSYQYKKSSILYELEQAIKKKVAQRPKSRDPHQQQQVRGQQASLEKKKNQNLTQVHNGSHPRVSAQRLPSKHKQSLKPAKGQNITLFNNQNLVQVHSHLGDTKLSEPKKPNNRKLDKLFSLINYAVSSADKAMKYINFANFQGEFAVKLFKSDKENLMNEMRNLTAEDLCFGSSYRQENSSSKIAPMQNVIILQQQNLKLKKQLAILQKQNERSRHSGQPVDLNLTLLMRELQTQKYKQSVYRLKGKQFTEKLQAIIQKQLKYQNIMSKGHSPLNQFDSIIKSLISERNNLCKDGSDGSASKKPIQQWEDIKYFIDTKIVNASTKKDSSYLKILQRYVASVELLQLSDKQKEKGKKVYSQEHIQAQQQKIQKIKQQKQQLIKEIESCKRKLGEMIEITKFKAEIERLKKEMQSIHTKLWNQIPELSLNQEHNTEDLLDIFIDKYVKNSGKDDNKQEQRIGMIQNELQSARNQNQMLQKQIQQKMNEIRNLDCHKIQLTEALNNKGRQLQMAQRQLHRLQKQFQDRQQKNNKLVQQNEKLQQIITNMQSQMQSPVDIDEDAKQESKQRLQALSQQNNQLNEKLDEIQMENENLSKQYEKMLQKNQKMSRQLSNLLSKQQVYKDNIDKIKGDLKRKEQQHNLINSQNEYLIESLRADIIRLGDQNNHNSKLNNQQIIRLQQQVTKSKIQQNNFQHQINILQQTIKQLESSKPKTMEQIQRMGNELTTLKSNSDILEQKLKQKQQQVSSLHENLANKERDYRQMEQQMQQRDKQMEKLRQNQNSVQEKLREALINKNKVEAMEIQKQKYLKKIGQLMNSQYQLNESLKLKNQELKQLQSQLSQKKQSVQQKSKQITTLTTQLEKITHKLSEQDTKIQNLNEQLSCHETQPQPQPSQQTEQIQNIKQTQYQLTQKEQQLKQKLAEIQDRFQQLNKREIELAGKLHEFDRKIQENQHYILSKEEELTAREKWIGAKQEQINRICLKQNQIERVIEDKQIQIAHKQQQVENMSKQLQDKILAEAHNREQQNSEKQIQLQQLRQKVKQFQQKTKDQLQHIEQRFKQIDEKQKQMQQKQQRLSHLAEALEVSETRVKQMMIQLTQKQKTSMQQIQEQQQALQFKQKQLAKSREQLQCQYSNKMKEVTQKQNQIATNLENLQKLAQEVKQKQEAHQQDLNKKIVQQCQQKLLKIRQKMEQQIIALKQNETETIQQLDKKILHLQNQLLRQKQQFEKDMSQKQLQFSKRQTILLQRCSVLDRQLVIKAQAIEQLNELQTSLQAQISQKAVLIEHLQKKIKNKQQQLETMNSRLINTQTENTKLTQQLIKISEDIDQNKRQKEKDQKKDMATSSIGQQGINNQKLQQYLDLIQKMQTKLDEYDQKQQQYEEMGELHENYKKSIAQQQQQLENITKDLNQTEQKYKQAVLKLQMSLISMEQLISQKERLQQQSHAQQRKIEELNENNKHLTQWKNVQVMYQRQYCNLSKRIIGAIIDLEQLGNVDQMNLRTLLQLGSQKAIDYKKRVRDQQSHEKKMRKQAESEQEEYSQKPQNTKQFGQELPPSIDLFCSQSRNPVEVHDVIPKLSQIKNQQKQKKQEIGQEKGFQNLEQFDNFEVGVNNSLISQDGNQGEQAEQENRQNQLKTEDNKILEPQQNLDRQQKVEPVNVQQYKHLDKTPEQREQEIQNIDEFNDYKSQKMNDSMVSNNQIQGEFKQQQKILKQSEPTKQIHKQAQNPQILPIPDQNKQSQNKSKSLIISIPVSVVEGSNKKDPTCNKNIEGRSTNKKQEYSNSGLQFDQFRDNNTSELDSSLMSENQNVDQIHVQQEGTKNNEFIEVKSQEKSQIKHIPAEIKQLQANKQENIVGQDEQKEKIQQPLEFSHKTHEEKDERMKRIGMDISQIQKAQNQTPIKNNSMSFDNFLDMQSSNMNESMFSNKSNKQQILKQQQQIKQQKPQVKNEIKNNDFDDFNDFGSDKLSQSMVSQTQIKFKQVQPDHGIPVEQKQEKEKQWLNNFDDFGDFNEEKLDSSMMSNTDIKGEEKKEKQQQNTDKADFDQFGDFNDQMNSSMMSDTDEKK